MSVEQGTQEHNEDTPSASGSADSLEPQSSERSLAVWLMVTATVALASSAMLVHERLQIFIDAGHSSLCDINALLNCGTVMRTPQAELFGFPNPFIGLVASRSAASWAAC